MPEPLAITEAHRAIATRATSEDVWDRLSASVQGMDRQVFGQMIDGLWAGCGRRDLPDRKTRQMWYLSLGDLTEEQFGRAIVEYLRNHSSEYPCPQRMRELSGAQQSCDDAGLLGWTLLLEAIGKHGCYASPEFSDPVIGAAVETLGGWLALCDQKSDELRTFTRQKFLAAYKAIGSSGRKVHHPELKGLIEKSGGIVERVRIGMSPRQEAQLLQ